MSSLEGAPSGAVRPTRWPARSGRRPWSFKGRALLLAWLPVACANGPGVGAPPNDGGSGGASTNGTGASAACEGEDCQTPAGCEVSGCPTGQSCQEDGRCSGGLDGTDLSGGGGSGGQEECVDVDVTFEEVIPTVALLIDRSASMQAFSGFGALVAAEIEAGTYEPWGCPEEPNAAADAEPQANRDWRWNVVRNVLFNPTTGVVPAFSERVRFGMALYTYQPDLAPDLCPELLEVDFALDHADELLAAMRCHDVGDKTPTREALTSVAAALAALQGDDPKMIIVATDGSPNSCACPGFGTSESILPACRDEALVERDGMSLTPNQAEKFDLVAEAARIFAETNIQISVIDVSSPDDTELHAHLADIAAAGGGEIWDGLHPSGLHTAFFDLVDTIASCAVDLDGTIEAGKEEQGTVVFDGEELALVNDPTQDGYRVLSPSRIELLGEPCSLLESGTHDLSITFPCDAFVVVK